MIPKPAKIVVSCLLGSLAAVSVLGQGLAGPLIMSPLQQLKDEFGQVLEGRAGAPGDLVVTYHATDGVIHPPDPTGVPHANNIAVPGGASSIGRLVPRRYTEPGVFNLVVNRKANNYSYIQNGNSVFVRVFNAPTIEEASFYTDSQIVVPKGLERFRLVFGTSSTDIPLDTADDDGDGLHNSYEKSLKTDKDNPDSDGDGMKDGDEFLAGTDGTDGESLLKINSMLQVENGKVFLSWESVPGKTYSVQADAFLSDTNGFVDIPNCLVAATSGVSRIVVPNQFLESFNNYRVIVCEDPHP